MQQRCSENTLFEVRHSHFPDLLVLWQDPESRLIHPIGRLTKRDETYTFCYTASSEELDNFHHLPGLEDAKSAHTSSVLFPLFAQRIMSPKRRDYTDYLNRLGLPEDMATPWEQIVYSGGRRNGDTIQFLPVPLLHDRLLEGRFLGHGLRHIPGHEFVLDGQTVQVDQETQEAALQDLAVGTPLDVVSEPGNPRSASAQVLMANGVPLAYVPEALAVGVKNLREYTELDCRVVCINGPTAPAHTRLAVQFTAAGVDVNPFTALATWQPVCGCQPAEAAATY